jgi:hypothetical protein
MKMTIEQLYLNKFPNGYFSVYHASLGDNHDFIRLGLIGKTELCANKIRENDPMHTVLSIQRNDEQFIVKMISGGLSLNPEKDSYYAMNTVKLPFRKFTAKNEKDLLNKMTKFFDKLRCFVDEKKTEIYRVEQYPAGII